MRISERHTDILQQNQTGTAHAQSLQDAWKKQLAIADQSLLDGVTAIRNPLLQFADPSAARQALPERPLATLPPAARVAASRDASPTLQPHTDHAGNVTDANEKARPDPGNAAATQAPLQLTAGAGRAVQPAVSAPELAAETVALPTMPEVAMQMAGLTAANLMGPVARTGTMSSAIGNIATQLVDSSRPALIAPQQVGSLPELHLVRTDALQEADVTDEMQFRSGASQSLPDALKKQHLHLVENEDGQVHLWLRDNALSEFQQNAVLQRIQYDLLRSGSWLAQATINGKPVFEAKRQASYLEYAALSDAEQNVDMPNNFSGLTSRIQSEKI
ncbi:hypothetical protein IGB42_02321 [Andreprevotia sp. IGB-42]|nr:hypothetical protein IGB42_02321 [Andreprevotia sp. IGB-42]